MNPQELLEAFLNAPGDGCNEYTDALSQSVRELVRRAVGKREVGDLEDFEEECVLAIWMKVAALKAGELTSGIDNLEAFVRQAVHNRYCDAIRRKRPKWYNIKLELLEVFSGKTGVTGLAVWQNPDGVGRLLGFDGWQSKAGQGSARCRELVENAASFRQKSLQNRDPRELPVYRLAAAVLDYCDGPVEADLLTSCIAELVQARNEEPLSIDSQPDDDGESAASPVDWLISPNAGVEEQVIGSSWFTHVIDWFWKEFKLLSVKQKKALLYGMPGDQVMALAAEVGMKEIANSVGISTEQLASLINALPLPDLATAEELGVLARAVPSVRFKAWGRIRRRTRKSFLAADAQ